MPLKKKTFAQKLQARNAEDAEKAIVERINRCFQAAGAPSIGTTREALRHIRAKLQSADSFKAYSYCRSLALHVASSVSVAPCRGGISYEDSQRLDGIKEIALCLAVEAQGAMNFMS